MMLEKKTTEFLEALASSQPPPRGGGGRGGGGAVGRAEHWHPHWV